MQSQFIDSVHKILQSNTKSNISQGSLQKYVTEIKERYKDWYENLNKLETIFSCVQTPYLDTVFNAYHISLMALTLEPKKCNSIAEIFLKIIFLNNKLQYSNYSANSKIRDKESFIKIFIEDIGINFYAAKKDLPIKKLNACLTRLSQDYEACSL